jgi:hypothetical protein
VPIEDLRTAAKKHRYSIASTELASASADVEAERFSGHKKSLRRRRGGTGNQCFKK